MTTLKYFINSKAKRNLLKFFLTDINACYYTREASRLTGEPLNAVRRELGYLEKAGLLRSYMQGNLKYYEVIKSFPMLAEWRKIILGTADSVVAMSQSCETEARQEAKQSAEHSQIVMGNGVAKQYPGSHATAKIQAVKHAPLEDGDRPIMPGTRVIPNHDAPDIAVKAKQFSESDQAPSPQPASHFTLDVVINHLREKFDDLNAITLAIIHGKAARSETIPEDGIELLVVGDINKDILLEILAALEVSAGIDISLMHMTSSDFDYRNAQGDPYVRRIWGEKKLVVKGRH